MQHQKSDHTNEPLLLIVSNSLITAKSQASNRLLAGGFVRSHPFIVVQALSSTTHQQVKK
jgi:hypothetical protein